VTNSGPPGQNLVMFEHAMLALFEHAMLAIKLLRKALAKIDEFCFWNSQSLPKLL
jgi:hypothetical protein